MREKKVWSAIDPALFFPVLILTGIGVVMVYSASSEIALRDYRNEYFFFTRQLVFACVGMGAMAFGFFFPYRFYKLLAYPMIVFSVLLLCGVFIPGIGHSAGGASRWIDFKWFMFQPSELARFSLIAYMAYSMAKKEDFVERFSIGFAPHVMLLLVFTALILPQPDFGTIVILWALTWIVMFAGRARLRYLLGSLIPIVPITLWLLVSSDYRLKRAMTFLDPWKYPHNEGYQIIHSLMAFGSGGLFGKGFGQGYQKLFYLPTPHTDFIFSVIGEEGGFVAVFFIIAMFMLIMWRGISVSISARDTFGALLSFGIMVSLMLQAIVNMGVDLSLLPTKGLTLPFLSYGGSALVFDLFCIGILMNIARENKR